MNRTLFIFFLSILNYYSFGQISDLVFIGAATVKDGNTYTYKLQMTDSLGILTGYSVTDIMGQDETKTAVSGTINTAKQQIDYHETKIIYTKSKAEKSDFCYIQGHLKIADVHGATTLKGHFKGYKEDGKTLCASGKLMLVSAQDVLDKLLKIAAKDSAAIKKDTTQKGTTYIYQEDQGIPESKILKVLPGGTKELQCSSPIIILSVWDAKTIDGDIITLQQDGNTILENYTLTGRQKQVFLNLEDNKTSVITLIAVSEGTEPMNTARVKITSGSDVYYIDATTTIGKNVQFLLKRR